MSRSELAAARNAVPAPPALRNQAASDATELRQHRRSQVLPRAGLFKGDTPVFCSAICPAQPSTTPWMVLNQLPVLLCIMRPLWSWERSLPSRHSLPHRAGKTAPWSRESFASSRSRPQINSPRRPRRMQPVRLQALVAAIQKSVSSRSEKLLDGPIALPENRPPKSMTSSTFVRFSPSACIRTLR